MEDELLLSILIVFDTRAFISELETNIIVRPQVIGGMRIREVSTAKRKIVVTPQMLSKHWSVILKASENTIKYPTQMGYISEQGFFYCIEHNRGNCGTSPCCMYYTPILYF